MDDLIEHLEHLARTATEGAQLAARNGDRPACDQLAGAAAAYEDAARLAQLVAWGEPIASRGGYGQGVPA